MKDSKSKYRPNDPSMQMPNAKMGMSEHPPQLPKVTLEGSGRSKFPPMKKFGAC